MSGLDEDITAEVTKALDAEITSLMKQALAERTEWEEAPSLYMLLEDSEGKLRLETVLTPEWTVWQIVPDPVRVLLEISEALHDTQLLAAMPADFVAGLAPAEGFCGVAFRVEAWGVKYDKDDDPEVQERLRRASVEHDLHLQPERIECRQMMACMRNGSMYWVQQERDGEPVYMEGADAAEERVVDAVKGIVDGISRLADAQR